MTQQKDIIGVASSRGSTAFEDLGKLRIALVNDWLVHVRGQERVFQVLCGLLPHADIYTFVYDPDSMPPLYRERAIHTSFVQHLPGSRRRFRVYLPLYPLAAKALNLRGYDLVIANSSAWSIGSSVGPRTVLVCYCHSPFRYIWSHYDTLVADRYRLLSKSLIPLRAAFRHWDLAAARRVDRFLVPSSVVKDRITRFYGRDSTIIPPPVDIDLFYPTGAEEGKYYLVVSPLMRWKRVDIAVQAFNALGLTLRVIGDGEESRRLKAMAAPNVEFLGWLSHRQINNLANAYSGCRAVIIPSAEDFGLAALEAMACGRPVIAFRGGGAKETVVEGRTGLFFDEQSPAALSKAVTRMNVLAFDRADIRRHAEVYGTSTFSSRVATELITTHSAMRARADGRPRRS